MNTTFPADADHLFVSYAWEDRALADWLTRKLTSEGYRVWCDRFKMLGGESFPKEIDQAIKTKTFRVLALLSKHSLNKANPLKERTLALGLAKQWGVDFLIPLNVDALSPSDLNWMLSDLTFIAFSSWTEGFSQLLKKLHSVAAPRPWGEQGRGIAASTFVPAEATLARQDTLFSNVFNFRSIPKRLNVYTTECSQTLEDFRESNHWSAYSIGTKCVSFDAPQDSSDLRFTLEREIDRFHETEIDGVALTTLMPNLLRQSLEYLLLKKGLRRDSASRMIYFPTGMFPSDNLSFRGYGGRATHFGVSGVRRLGAERFRYHVSPSFFMRSDLGSEFSAQMRLRLFITDLSGKPLEPSAAFPRRKAVAKNWFNHQWASRQWGVAQFLSDGSDAIRLGGCESEPLVLDAIPMSGSLPTSVNDKYLEPIRKKLKAKNPDLVEDESEPEVSA
jgi:hypothetical protein